MKRFFLLTLFCMTVANESFGRTLNSSTFQVHVRPQLIGIQQDVQQIFLVMPEYPSTVFQALNLVDQLLSQAKSARRACPRELQKTCLLQLQASLTALRDLDRLWITQESRFTTPADGSLSSMAGRSRWLQMMESIWSLKASLEMEVIAIQAERKGDRIGMWQWEKKVDEIEDWLDILVIEFVPARLQENFRSAWMNFFRPLYKQGVLANNRKFLSTNLESLNFYWNLLNMKLTKRMKNTPEGMSGPLNAIQNRWNQVMRIQYGQ